MFNKFIEIVSRVQGWIQASEVIMVIFKVFYKDLVDFIVRAVDHWDTVIKQLEGSGAAAEVIEALKHEAGVAVERTALQEFSSSPPYAPLRRIKYIRDMYIDTKRMKDHVTSQKERERYDAMQFKHGISSGKVEDIKAAMSQPVRDMFFPSDE